MSASLVDIQSRLPELMVRDQRRLQQRLSAAYKIKKAEERRAAADALAVDVEAAERRIAARRAGVPAVTYPAELPVSERRDEIAAAIRDHQVVIVAGETGSGKTTQLPKICLELGLGVRGMIGHTQPRRIAARTVADRIAEELGVPLGTAVGYQVRFTGQVGDETLVKLMTDGILLAEIQTDRALHRYDTIIIDEAHERSLNVDFLLGYLKQLLPRRPDLKVVITSATIDPERFSRFFDDAPIVEVSGRTYPVEVRYRPLLDVDDVDEEEPRDQVQAIADAVDELRAEGPGDILVFLSGEREIRDTADALRKRDLPHTEILPLYARLSTAEQHRVFAPHAGRRVVLATNVAETSLTVPGIKYVIDPGTARVSRYSHRLKVQRLPIEPVSQASAHQRAGRCGRTSDGICVRLYAESDFAARPEFTDPEILRTNLASVILQMTALGLGDLAAFPFLDPPDRRQVTDGVNLLHELGALDPVVSDPRKRLTPLGRRLAQLPIDPRLGRMVLEAERNGCVREVLIVAAGLSIQDPRERPAERQQAADQAHARFADAESDFTTYLNLWHYLQDKQKELSSGQFRRLCRAEFLNYLRVREWQDLFGQLRQVSRGLGVPFSSAAEEPQRIHQALLAGLLSHIGAYDPEKRDYLGARGARFAIFPGSALFRKSPRWAMAAELVETSRLWARVVARIEPEWVEPLAGHLVKRAYSEPHWEAKQGAVMAYERVTLYGVPIVVQRKVNYGRIDPELSRELFIRRALVEGDWRTHHAFFAENRRLLDEVEELEHRARRRDIVVDDETLYAFYDARIPADVVSGQHFDAWWKKARHARPDLLSYTASLLINESAGRVSKVDYPDEWPAAPGDLRLSYQFEPGAAADGVTVHIPLPALGELGGAGFDWQVPGVREELVTALIRSLPKADRRNFVPVPDFARAALAGLRPGDGALTEALARELTRLTGVVVRPEAFDLGKVPDHLRLTYRVEDADGAALAEGKDLAALRERLVPKTAEVMTTAAAEGGLERHGLREYPGELPRTFEGRQGAYRVRGYPALVDEGEAVGVTVFPTEAEQRAAMARGTRRLLQLTVPSPIPLLSKRLAIPVKLGLTRYPYGTVPELLDDCVDAAVDALVAGHGGPAWDPAGFAALREAVRAALPDATAEVVTLVERVVAAAHGARQRLSRLDGVPLRPAISDMRTQLVALQRPGFAAEAGAAHLPDLPRYLRAIERRAERLPANPARDAEWMAVVARVQAEYDALLAALPPATRADPEVREIRWMIEELRVSFFAQELKTAYPVSEKRIYRAMDAVG